MPSVRYYNQTSPFWDFVADLENQGAPHAFGNRSGDINNPWANGFGGGWPFGPMPHRGRHGPPHGRHHHGPPPPPEHEHHGPPPPPPQPEQPEAGPSEPRDPPTSCPEEPAGPPPYSGHSHGPHHRPEGRRGRCGGRGGWGGRGRGGPYGFPTGEHMPPFMNNLAEMFNSQFFSDGAEANNETREASAPSDFKPEVDVFDTPESFVVHISLPGAKKEDVGVNWDAEKSELSVAGVVYRPGDEELLQSLALDERKVGAFERKVRLGSRANPAQVDVDAISAKMEDGVLRVTVPKQDAEYVEIKKVDIE